MLSKGPERGTPSRSLLEPTARQRAREENAVPLFIGTHCGSRLSFNGTLRGQLQEKEEERRGARLGAAPGILR